MTRPAPAEPGDPAHGDGRTWPWALAVALPNLVIYSQHYFGRAGIPWDFPMSYYAMVAFWTSIVREGVLPQWMPFQQMGFPFSLQPQSGIHYLPHWFFPVTDIPYTVHAAVVFQCLHVLAGGYGMFVLVRTLRRSNAEALFAAVAFQCFGGFFSNAEHVDIVRAYAFTPWLLYVFTLDRALVLSADVRIDPAPAARPGTPWRIWMIPLVLYLLLTGGYPGNVFAAGLLAGVYVLWQLAAQAAADRRRGAGVGPTVQTSGLIVAMVGLGCGMAALHLGPLGLFSDQFVRAQPLAAAARSGLWIEHLPGLFLSNVTLPGEISMTSAYVTLPVLVLASFVPWRDLRQHAVWLVLLVLAVVMIGDEHVRIGTWVRAHVPLLGLSRFPSSDYRAWIAIPLILLAADGLRTVVSGQQAWASLAGRSLFCLLWVWLGVRPLANAEHAGEAVLAVGVAVVVIGVVILLGRRTAGMRPIVVAGVVALIAIDAARVLPAIPGWYEPDREAYYLYVGAPSPTRNRGRRLAPSLIPANLPARRPPREKPAGLVRWAGYINGGFYANDLTPNVLRKAYVVETKPEYQQYMRREWLPIVVPPPDNAGTPGRAVLTDDQFRAALDAASPDPAIRQLQYGINDITYDVTLAEPRLFVENEVHFPGWAAQLVDDPADGHGVPPLRAGAPTTIAAVEVNGVFRGWMLPAGRYRLLTSFALPYLNLLRAISAVSGLAWLAALAARRFVRGH